MNIQESCDDLNNCGTEMPYFSFNNEIHLAKVIKCYDGDTIHCIFKHNGQYQKFKIRMYNYDSPELRPSRKLSEDVRISEIQKAKAAKIKIENLILNKNVYLFCKHFDKYGRILGEIKVNFDDDKTINQIMVEEGYGYPYYGGSKKKSLNK